jgi:tetratricopeptide (TPR) repeat protein
MPDSGGAGAPDALTQVESLHEKVVSAVFSDTAKAEAVAVEAKELATGSGSEHAMAIACRAMGHVHYAKAEYTEALRCYQEAVETFERLGRGTDSARTRTGALQTLIYLGRYDEAREWAEQARAVFEANGDHLRLARLDSNLGNLYYRQDRYKEALDLYQKAYEQFQVLGQPRDVAAALSNMAVCSISLHDFARGLETYEEARSWCEKHGMSVLVAEADYNIAYLHFLRGEYTTSIGLYEKAREYCRKAEDHYHLALCDLDQAELFLELNLWQEAGQLARQAEDGFARLGMGYERAKALTLMATAESYTGPARRAMRLYSEAQKGFQREKNAVAAAQIELQRALVLAEWRRDDGALRRCRRAWRFFVQTPLETKTALCELLMARLRWRRGENEEALSYGERALLRLAADEHPNLRFHAEFLLGRVHESMGEDGKARLCFEKAEEWLEALRSRVSGDELKAGFLKDKHEFYAHKAMLILRGDGEGKERAAYEVIERAKSRSLADLIAFQGQTKRPGLKDSEGSAVALRQELNGYYRQLEKISLEPEERARQQAASLRKRVRECEQRLAARMAEMRAAGQGYAALHDPQPIGTAAIQAAIPQGAQLVEYFEARGSFHAAIVDRRNLQIVPVCKVAAVREDLRLLRFQLAKFRLGESYARVFGHALFEAARFHLQNLYRILIGPLQNRLDAEHLILVPHGDLHHLPFHALFDGEQYVMDRYSVSYVPSGSVFAQCRERDTSGAKGSLVLGVADASTPFLEAEARAAAGILPQAELYLGPEVSFELLRQRGAERRFLHIATHGTFRADNPMFSSIRLGEGQCNLFDLYDLRLNAELVTLSGCSTGLNDVVGGDELLGLVRGLMHAGAAGVLLTMWDVNDRCASELVRAFYRKMLVHKEKASALRSAMKEVRTSHPHPYYWAPFMLLGNYGG